MLKRNLIVAGLCAIGLVGSASYGATKATALDLSELQAVCQATQQKLDELTKSGKVKLSKDSGAFDCLKTVEEQYENICSSGAADCERYASGGFIYWMWGAEVNMPTPAKLRSKNLRWDARGVFGLSAMHVTEGGDGLSHWRFSVIFQPTVSFVKDRPARLALSPDQQVTEPDLYQQIRKGLTFVLLPKGPEANLTVEDIFVQPKDMGSNFTGEMAKAQVGAFWEGKMPYQKGNDQQLIVLSTNASGVAQNIKDAATLKGLVSMNNLVLFINMYQLQGEFQPRSEGLQLSQMIELFSLGN